MTLIAISSEGPTLDALVDPRFGRAAGFVVVDTEILEFRYLDNGASQVLAQGAGIQAVEILAKEGVSVLLTGVVGPKAQAALQAADIQIVQGMDNQTVRSALEKFQSGQIHENHQDRP